ncbi:hypothetical protein Ga0074812_12756 [Parafrankia irregularis]|uniref:Uncharacterized protein n=1 Tax=Parafrankia irregularis TaxID=795642 RepID=A0A0S4QV63_9ACTN|nr:hypothetical protein Ga0074812_12756 [Parafrankia irregularis]
MAVLLPHPATDIPVLLALSAVWLTVWAVRETSLRREPAFLGPSHGTEETD